jgi:hypothetical protein
MTNFLLLFILFLPKQANWSQWGGSNRNFSIDMSINDVESARPLKEVWKAKVDAGLEHGRFS